MGYTDNLIAWYDLSNINPPNLSPIRPGQYDGTGVNLVVADVVDGIAGGQCLRLDGNNKHVIIGDVLELNATEKFTIAFWMNQKIIDQTDNIFVKFTSGTSNIQILTTGGNLRFRIGNGAASWGEFDYSTIMSAGVWHHVVMVFDGSQAGNATRLVVYIDGAPITLVFTLVIPVITSDQFGRDTYLGFTASSFDGKFDELVILNAALTQTQVNDLMIRQRRGLL